MDFNLLRTSRPLFCSTHCFFMELKRDFFFRDALVMRSLTVWAYFLGLQGIMDFTRDSAFCLAAGDLSSLICISSSSWLSVHCSRTSIEAADWVHLEAFNVLEELPVSSPCIVTCVYHCIFFSFGLSAEVSACHPGDASAPST